MMITSKAFEAAVAMSVPALHAIIYRAGSNYAVPRTRLDAADYLRMRGVPELAAQLLALPMTELPIIVLRGDDIVLTALEPEPLANAPGGAGEN